MVFDEKDSWHDRGRVPIGSVASETVAESEIDRHRAVPQITGNRTSCSSVLRLEGTVAHPHDSYIAQQAPPRGQLHLAPEHHLDGRAARA
ncbi:MAG: hypothetical protein ACK55I_26820 [bacterium]